MESFEPSSATPPPPSTPETKRWKGRGSGTPLGGSRRKDRRNIRDEAVVLDTSEIEVLDAGRRGSHGGVRDFIP